MKKRIALTIILLIAASISLTGCGKIKNKISEKIGEKIVEKAIGGDVKVTDDGTKVEKDGASMETGSSLKWPKENMGNLPEPKGKISFILKGSELEGCTVTFTDMKLEDATEYIEKLKELEYKDGYEFSDGEGVGYSGTNSDGATTMFTYGSNSLEGSIVYAPAKKE